MGYGSTFSASGLERTRPEAEGPDMFTDTAVVAALVAALASLLVAWMSSRSSRRAENAVQAQKTQDYVIRQLNELYGPLYVRRKLSRRLREQIGDSPDPEPGVPPWKLIDHIEELKQEPDERRRLVVEQILKINDELVELIVGKAGLLESLPPPESFELFLEHALTLRLYWEQGANAVAAAYKPFPGQLDSDVEAALKRLRGELQSEGS
jgi:hypothetical protein